MVLIVFFSSIHFCVVVLCSTKIQSWFSLIPIPTPLIFELGFKGFLIRFLRLYLIYE